ncbi:MAG: ATP-binding protein [Acidimicrobiia bacterium]|nr:ATP-binding protein [Acidimicrobiia bacterium]
MDRLTPIPLIVIAQARIHPLPPRSCFTILLPHFITLRTQSLLVTSNKNFSSSAEIFGDAVAVAAMVDRLVHHAEVIVLKGQSYRLRGKRTEAIHQPTH